MFKMEEDEIGKELLNACRDGELSVVISVIEKHYNYLNINWQDEDGWSPLFYACSNGHDEIVSYLLSFNNNNNNNNNNNLNVNIQTNAGQTPFSAACMENRVKTVELLLLHHRVDINIREDNNNISMEVL